MNRNVCVAVIAVLLVIMSVTRSQAACPIDQTKSLQKKFLSSNLTRIEETLSEQKRGAGSWVGNIWLTTHLLPGIDAEGGLFCDVASPNSYFGWLIEVPTTAIAAIFELENEIEKLLRSERGYLRSGRLLFNAVTEEAVFADSTISFLASQVDLFFPREEGKILKLAVSGPSWRLSEFGEDILGYLKTSENGVRPRKPYNPALAGYILCIKEGRITLIQGERQASWEELKGQMDAAADHCGEAIQVGPSFLRRDVNVSEQVTEDLREPQHRNILLRTTTGGREKTYLWSSAQPIPWVDASLITEDILASLEGDIAESWAVGLAGGKRAAGPYLFDKHGLDVNLSSGENTRVGAMLLLYETSE